MSKSKRTLDLSLDPNFGLRLNPDSKRKRGRISMLLCLLLPSVATADLVWQRVPTPSRGAPLTAMAVDGAGERVALGDATGVLLREREGEPFRRVARVEAVTDLHFDTGGALWIGSLKGLYRRDAEGRIESRSPASGDAGRIVRRVLSSDGILLLATDAGAFASTDGRAWQRMGGALASMPVQAMAARADGAHATLYALAGPDLWQIDVRRENGALRFQARRADPIPGRPGAEVPVDVALDAGTAELVVLYPRHLALWSADAWHVHPLALPPQARARRFARAGGRLFIAHDRGLSQSETSSGEAWRRAAPPAGRAPARRVVATRTQLLVATEQGLLAAPRTDSAAPPPRLLQPLLPEPAGGGGGGGRGRGRPAPPLATEPDVREVQRAALRYLSLEPERFRELRDHLRWRGWLPNLSLSFGIDERRDWGEDYDEAFITGDTRFLNDRDRSGERDYEGRVILSWDLSDAAYDPEVIDLSREARQVVALRDDVLDEINQVYFERRRLQAELAGLADPEGLGAAEARRLRVRIQELRAGLDAWTGGWFSTALRESP